MNLIWKDIPEYEKLYQVSNYGTIKSLNYGNTKQEKLLKLQKNRDGYLYVVLYKNKHSKYFLVHRLVASAFLDNPNNLPIINHKDENKQNNHVSNLEYCTVQYNITYNDVHIRRGEKYKGKNNWNYGKHHTEETIQKMRIANGGENNGFYGKHHTEETKQRISKVNSKPILQYTLNGEFIREWESGKKASETLKINYIGISNNLNNRSKSSGGFIWKYKE